MLRITRQDIVNFAFLHIVYILYSFTSVCSKSAASQAFLSWNFFLFLGLLVLLLGIYAVLWQQVIKRFSLVKAYSNKGVVIIWNLLWAVLLFNEKITLSNVLGGAAIIIGIVVVSSDAV